MTHTYLEVLLRQARNGVPDINTTLNARLLVSADPGYKSNAETVI